MGIIIYYYYYYNHENIWDTRENLIAEHCRIALVLNTDLALIVLASFYCFALHRLYMYKSFVDSSVQYGLL